ncbi:1-aminocyclopropane-1-carboxylate deaminase/D-cysteine desulfhydrase [Pseudofulvibacter geojedonensis]|uniref:1-aminocyclopropane-1-carboxylate deaminase/D-cysteine desulfhydrase n=1 Tax=Pseudofulvibacter geojedonensis TaxID=1123758 RepID=A0ABW3I4I8_9FLAO
MSFKGVNNVIRGNLNTVRLSVKRDDLLGKGISGNKFRKLKYNLCEVNRLKISKVLTFGGAYSNHIYAASFVKKLYGIDVIGVVRGEELKSKIHDNPTLLKAQENGMQFHFVTREEYRRRKDQAYINTLRKRFGCFYLLPEGGTNSLAIKGCEEILDTEDKKYDYVCCPVGTGGTMAGLINSSKENQEIIGFSALKGDFLKKDITQLTNKTNWQLQTDYHFGGYAKINRELVDFINEFKRDTGILLDPIYNGKMMFGIYDLIKKEYFPKNRSILAIHTGGLQAIEGMNKLLLKKGMPLINI